MLACGRYVCRGAGASLRTTATGRFRVICCASSPVSTSSNSSAVPTTLQQLQNSGLHSSYNLFSTNEIQRGLIGALAVAAAAGLMISDQEAVAHCDGKNKALSFKETTAYLKLGLGPIRDSLKKKGYHAPYLTVKDETVHGKPPRMRITMDRASLYGLGAWMSLLKAPIYLVEPSNNSNEHALSKGQRVKDSCEFSDELDKTAVYMEIRPTPHLSMRKTDGFTKAELDALISSYEGICLRSDETPGPDFNNFKMTPFAAFFDGLPEGNAIQFGGPNQGGAVGTNSSDLPESEEKVIAELVKLGLKVYSPGDNEAMNWGQLAGYSTVKKEITDTILNYLQHPDIYDDIVKRTRQRFESNRPRAVLFEGPPGTGKTVSARVIAGACNKHMVHLPVEAIVSKWYGESEKSLTKIMNLCEKLGGCVIFIDEIDAMAPSRGGEIHEATRRILSVLLQRLEGFDGRSDNILVCATNRKKDLDAALISRFNVIIKYDLPDTSTRADIFMMYAKQLNKTERLRLADISEGLSCRSIKDICEQTERVWASKIIADRVRSGNNGTVALPGCEDYTTQLKKYMASHEDFVTAHVSA